MTFIKTFSKSNNLGILQDRNYEKSLHQLYLFLQVNS